MIKFFGMVTKKDIQYIAKLSRLGLTEKEIEKFQKDLSKIFDYIKKLKEVDVLNVKPTTHSTETPTENVLRIEEVIASSLASLRCDSAKDEVQKQEITEIRKKLIKQAIETTEQNYIKTQFFN